LRDNFQIGIAMSPRETAFGPLLFSGQLENGIRQLAQNDIAFIELSLRKTNDINTQELHKLLNHHNIKVTALATGQACLFDNLCLSNMNDESRNIAIDHLKSMIELAAELSSGAVIIGGIRGKLTGSEEDKKLQRTLGIEAIGQCAEYAKKFGIMILIEPINRYEMNWINTAEEGLEVIAQLSMQSLKLLLDTFHMNIEEKNMIEAIRPAGEQLGYLHFADNNRHAPGQGQLDFASILKVLNEIGYTGPIVSEILPLPDDLSALKDTAAFWKNLDYQF